MGPNYFIIRPMRLPANLAVLKHFDLNDTASPTFLALEPLHRFAVAARLARVADGIAVLAAVLGDRSADNLVESAFAV